MEYPADVKPYDITGGERVTYGYYAALESVFQQFINLLESQFFDMFNLSIDFEVEIRSGTKFRRYLDTVHQPVPILVFNLSPMIGDCLLVLDNRSANLMLSREGFSRHQATVISDAFTVNTENYRSLYQSVNQILPTFYHSWGSIFKAEGRIKRLVSNRLKAKIMGPLELCVIVRLHLRQKRFHAVWDFCFSAYQLDQVIKHHGAKVLLTGIGCNDDGNPARKQLMNRLLAETCYDLRGVLGQLNISSYELNTYFQQGRVIPLKNEIRDNVVVYVNDVPLLSAAAGVTRENLSLQINGRYEKVKTECEERPKPFTPLVFPKLSA
jgi:flagellar motor switch protein FliM